MNALVEAALELRSRVIAADPARQRVRLGSRASLSLVLALAVMSAVTHVAGQPFSVAMLGAVVGMVTSNSVKDETHRSQVLTIALAPLASAAAVTVAATLSKHQVLADIAFVVVMVTAVWARRFGPRGTALGMVAFMSFFFALFLRATDHQVPWLALAAVVGAASTALVRIVLLPERPGPDLRRLLTATRGHTAVVTQRTAELLEHAGAISDNRLRRLRRAVRELDAVALLVEQQLTGEYAERLVDDPEQVRGLVFDVEMAAQHFARAVGQDADKLPEGAIRELSEASRRLAHVLRISHPAPGQEALTAIAPREPGDWRQPEHHVRAALARLAGELDALASIDVRRHPAPAMPGRSDGPDDAAATSPNDAAVSAPDDAAPPDGRGLRERLSPTDRTAVQVLVAGSLAIAVGQAISMQRWYWAVIGTFVVFTNTQTRADTLRRAGSRILGTALGVVAGLALGEWLSGDSRIELALIVVLVFAAFWVLQVSYTAMVMCVTIVLALLYSLLGTLSGDVLVLRVEMTLVGAGIGGAVAVLILPSSGRGAFDDAVAATLERIDDLLATMQDDPRPGSALLRDRVRDLDRAFQDLRTATRPLVAGLPGPLPAAHRRQLLLVGGARWWARLLANVVSHADADLPPSADLAAARTAVAEVLTLVRQPDALPDEPPAEQGEPPVSDLSSLPTAVLAVQRLRESLQALAQERGSVRQEATHRVPASSNS